MPVVKLQADDTDNVLRAIAAGVSVPKVVKDLKQKHGIDVTERRVWQLQKEYAERVELYREEYRSTFGDTPLAYTKHRVDELSRLFHDASDVGDIDTQLSTLRELREETKYLNLEGNRGRTKEVETFLQSLDFGRADPERVPADAGPADSD